eukprot:5878022-Pyramimonas_sp.AAC.1
MLYTTPGVAPGRVSRVARHLGPYLDESGSLAEERARRLAAARSNNGMLGTFWSSSTPRRVRCGVFKAFVDT